jgi:hypothetical protein
MKFRVVMTFDSLIYTDTQSGSAADTKRKRQGMRSRITTADAAESVSQE